MAMLLLAMQPFYQALLLSEEVSTGLKKAEPDKCSHLAVVCATV
jgi:hypothetical protein